MIASFCNQLVMPVMALALTVQSGCHTKIWGESVGLAEALSAHSIGDDPRKLSGEGYMSLEFEQVQICDTRERSVCVTMVPTEAMMLHREAYNRSVVNFEGVIDSFRKGGFCARDCNYTAVEITSVEPPEELLLNAKVKADTYHIDFERVVFDNDVDAYRELSNLTSEFMARLDNVDRLMEYLGFSHYLKGASNSKPSVRQRVGWIAQIIGNAGSVLRRPAGYHFAQERDELSPKRLSPDGVVCFCLRAGCTHASIRLRVANQSVNDPLLCLPVTRESGQWRFEREFFEQ